MDRSKRKKRNQKRIGGATGGEFLHEEIPDVTPPIFVSGEYIRTHRISWDHSNNMSLTVVKSIMDFTNKNTIFSLTYWMWASPSPKMANEHVVWWIVIVRLYPDVMVNYMGAVAIPKRYPNIPSKSSTTSNPQQNDYKVCFPLHVSWRYSTPFMRICQMTSSFMGVYVCYGVFHGFHPRSWPFEDGRGIKTKIISIKKVTISINKKLFSIKKWHQQKTSKRKQGKKEGRREGKEARKEGRREGSKEGRRVKRKEGG